jgi:hypothetical protein
MLFSCDAHVTHAHTTLSRFFFCQSEAFSVEKKKAMFTSLDRLLPHRAGDYLAPGTNADHAFMFALSVLEARGITQGFLVVLDRNELTLPELMTHVVQESDESATLTVLSRKTNLCSCPALGPVPLRVEFQIGMVEGPKRRRLDRSPKAQGWQTSIRVKCFHCEALKTLKVSSSERLAIPVPSAPVICGKASTDRSGLLRGHIEVQLLFR